MGFDLQYQQSEQRETSLPICLLKYKKKYLDLDCQ